MLDLLSVKAGAVEGSMEAEAPVTAEQLAFCRWRGAEGPLSITVIRVKQQMLADGPGDEERDEWTGQGRIQRGRKGNESRRGNRARKAMAPKRSTEQRG